MIVFDLRCGHGHVFEAWFRSSADYASQRDTGLIACPICADTAIDKAVMAPNVSVKGNRAVAAAPHQAKPVEQAPVPQEAREMLAAIAAVQAKLLEKSQWVGGAFADQARAMHQGETPHRLIHGQASMEDARALAEEGVAVAPLLVPVIPPEARN